MRCLEPLIRASKDQTSHRLAPSAKMEFGDCLVKHIAASNVKLFLLLLVPTALAQAAGMSNERSRISA